MAFFCTYMADHLKFLQRRTGSWPEVDGTGGRVTHECSSTGDVLQDTLKHSFDLP